MEYTTLPNGNKMPMLGLGVYQVPDHEECEQAILRFNIQRGVVVIPKSVHKDRIKENIDVFDFALTDDEMKQIASLETGHTEIIDHYDWKITEFLNTVGK
ncbi:aldo/keto reductase [Hespellia stercorisuis]|uniref:Aldo/keto reductase family protein n=1 Tax=Hespellia stercorisuis DSM 15480 TaxID=1121950 RepID=A0A1M6M803_9FIRM|nr:aldo/keto reductase [Hespellia stercorisuis]SHJ79520.1 Aldo/keto reductase family protein [Hespellia stercorisuis DSM 15480]